VFFMIRRFEKVDDLNFMQNRFCL